MGARDDLRVVRMEGLVCRLSCDKVRLEQWIGIIVYSIHALKLSTRCARIKIKIPRNILHIIPWNYKSCINKRLRRKEKSNNSMDTSQIVGCQMQFARDPSLLTLIACVDQKG